MTIQLEVSGDRYEGFDGAEVEIRLDALSNTFSFEASSSRRLLLPFKGGEPCRVFVDGEVVLTGNIEVVTVEYSAGSHNISVQGRDKTGDLLDSTLPAFSDLRGPGLTLRSVIERTIQELGVDIEVIENVTTEPFNEAEDIGSPEPGENAFEFIERWARKRQVLLTSDPDGNIVIESGSGESVRGLIQNIVDEDDNNILSSSVSYDTTGRYNLYKFVSSMNVSALNFAGDIGTGDIVDQSGNDVRDIDVRAGRILVMTPENSSSSEQNDVRAEWEKNIRKARGSVYSVILHDFRDQDGALWQVNRRVAVADDFADIAGQMLINSVLFTDNLDGSTCTLTMVPPDAYNLEASEPRQQETGGGLFS